MLEKLGVSQSPLPAASASPSPKPWGDDDVVGNGRPGCLLRRLSSFVQTAHYSDE